MPTPKVERELIERFYYTTTVSIYKCSKCNGKGEESEYDDEYGRTLYYACRHCYGGRIREEKKTKTKYLKKIKRRKLVIYV